MARKSSIWPLPEAKGKNMDREKDTLSLCCCRIGGVTMDIRGGPELDSLLRMFSLRMADFRRTGEVDLTMNIVLPVSATEPVRVPTPGQSMADACISLILKDATSFQRRHWLQKGMTGLRRLLLHPAVMPLLDAFLKKTDRLDCVPLEAGFLLLDGKRNTSLLLLDEQPVGGDPRAEGLWLTRVNITAVNAVMCCLALRLAATDGVVAHAVGLNYRGGGYAFAASSGGGKTTLSMQSPPGAVLADDGLVIRRQGEGYILYPTPFRQRPGGDTHQWNWHQTAIPLTGLCLLEKSGESGLVAVSRLEAVDLLLRASTHFFSWMGPEAAVPVFDFWRELVRRLPVARLKWRKGDDVFSTLKNLPHMEAHDENQERTSKVAVGI
jgi:hypothetical protein